MNSLDANIRNTKTKGELNSLRDNGNVPAIIYGGEAQNEKISISKKLLLFGGGILWLLSSIAGLYHFGIEMSFWTGPDGCSSSIDFSKDIFEKK